MFLGEGVSDLKKFNLQLSSKFLTGKLFPPTQSVVLFVKPLPNQTENR